MNSEFYKIIGSKTTSPKVDTNLGKKVDDFLCSNSSKDLNKKASDFVKWNIEFAVPKNEYGSQDIHILEWRAKLFYFEDEIYYYNIAEEVEFRKDGKDISATVLQECLTKLYEMYIGDFCEYHIEFSNILASMPKSIDEKAMNEAVGFLKERITMV